MAYGNFKEIQSPYFATGDPETEESTTLYAPGMLGCIAQFDRGGVSGPQNVCVYQLVQLDAFVSAVGQIVTWLSKAASTVTNQTAVNGNVAGIVEKVAAVSTYVWIVKKGDRPVLFVDAPTVAPSLLGLPVVQSTTAAKADCLAKSQTQAAFPLLGTTFGTQDGTSKLGTVRLNIPDGF
jgi:hypothetical protein